MYRISKLLVVLFLLCACSKSEVEILDWKPSSIYEDADILDAIKVVEKDFRHFKDATLLTITYIGDEKNNDYKEWADRYEADEVLVLVSSFQTGNNPDASLEKNEIYRNYKWILVLKDGRWYHVDHGY